MSEKIVLIDGHSILNRAFYGVPILTNSEGLPTNAVYGFLNIMFKILEEEHPQYLTVAFDVKEPTFRHKMYGEYKGTRKPMPEELHRQVPLIKETLSAMGVKVVECPGFEADDILGTIAALGEKQGLEVSLVSGDRDLLQLASDHICVRIPKTKKGVTQIEDYHIPEVVAAYQVTPREFIDVKALMGDASDNIPGVPGIGEKTAQAIISAYHSIENAREHVDEIKPARAQNALREHYDMAVLSKELATIRLDCPLEFELEQARLGNLFTKEAYSLMKRFEFKSMMAKFDSQLVKEETKEWEEAAPQEIRDYQEACELLDLLAGKQKERAGLWFAWDKEELLALSVTTKKGTYVIFCQYFITRDLIRDKIRQVFSKGSSAAIGLKDQIRHLKLSGFYEKVQDLAVGAYLLNPLKDTYEYDDISRDYLNQILPSRQDLLGKMPLGQAVEEKPEEFLKLCSFNSQTAYRAWEPVMEALKREGMEELYRNIEMPLMWSLSHMECWGIQADKGALKVYGDKLAVRIEALEGEIYELTGEEFNINSPKQLGEILFEKLKLPHAKKTKTGYSTAADVLEKLKGEHPVIDRILEYRQLAKLKSTYADGLAVFIREDGRIHGTFNQTITATGRISSTEPNLQNIPVRMELGREIRKVFVPEDGYVFVDADYSQIELRVLAHMSGDEKLIEAYHQAQDIHAITASQVFHIPLEEVTPLQRRNAKAVNFGIVYGISAFGLSEDLSISRKEATEYIERYFETYPKVKEFLDALVAKAKETGRAVTMFGRIRPVPELTSSNFMQRQFGERVAMNSPIQGTAADIIKIAMVRTDRRLCEEGLKSRLVLQIHDELLIEAAEDEVEKVKEILSQEMHAAAELKVPLEIDMHTGSSWFDAK